MAQSAGRAAIVPKGDWSASVAYTRLDAVVNNNILYIAKRDVPSGTPLTNTTYWFQSINGGSVPIATTTTAGKVKPDGTTITIDADGTIHGSANVDIATTSKAGIVKPDGTTIKVANDGTITVNEDSVEEVRDILGLILPDGYRQVEYLESHGTEYIDTGYIFNLNTDEITVDVRFVDNAEYRTPISVNNVLQVYPSLNWYAAYICNGSTWESGTFGVLDNKKHHIVFNSTGAYIDGTTVLTPTGIIAEGANLRLFITQSSVAGLFKIYDVKVKHNNVLVRHFVPCFRQSDSTVGMYDVVNNVFYDNDGTGTFGYNELLTLPEITDRMHGPLDIADGGTGKTSLASTKYTTLEYRGESLNSSGTTPTVNGTIAWTYS